MLAVVDHEVVASIIEQAPMSYDSSCIWICQVIWLWRTQLVHCANALFRRQTEQWEIKHVVFS